jgi:hypothetical protein
MKWPLITYILLILLLTMIPTSSATGLSDITIIELRGDYWIHIFMFAPWAFLKPQKMSLLPWVVLGFVFAMGTESVQYFLPYRSFNVNDLMANGVGILLGSLIKAL